MPKERLRTAILEAIQAEKNAMDFYREAAERCYNERPKLTFKLLAHEERDHARSFYNAYPWDDLEPFETLMAAPADTGSDWWRALSEVVLGQFDEKAALALALAQEKLLESDLRETAKTIEEPEIRAVYLTNARLTQQHQTLIETDYQAISQSG